MRHYITGFLKIGIPKLIIFALLFACAATVNASYEAHGNNVDMEAFLTAYPDAAGTRLDDCFLCHPGGSVETPKGMVEVGSCDYCHKVYGYDKSGSLPFNSFGIDYQKASLISGRTVNAIDAVKDIDSDNDKFTNDEEIKDGAFPGDANDHPGLSKPPMVKLTREEILSLPSYEEMMLINSEKGGDYYARYQGISFDTLLNSVGARDAESLTFFSIDGFSSTIPINDSGEGSYLVGAYQSNTYYANLEWVTYPAGSSLKDGELIYSKPVALLAYIKDGSLLSTGEISSGSDESRIAGEGPYRLIIPQRIPSPPDQPSTKIYLKKPFPFDRNAEHNAKACVKSIVAIRVNPLPDETNDLNWNEWGWKLIEEGSLVVYGAIKEE